MPLTYFTLAELRALPDVSDTARYTDARCTSVGESVEALIEREVGTSFVVRTFTETHDGTRANVNGGKLVLRERFVRAVSSVTAGGVALTTAELDELEVVGSVLERPVDWPEGRQNVEVTYTAGYSAAPPADVKEAALAATRFRLLTSDSRAGVEGRQTSMQTDQGTIQFLVAGQDRPTGYPDVDSVILSWKRELYMPGVA